MPADGMCAAAKNEIRGASARPNRQLKQKFYAIFSAASMGNAPPYVYFV